jgi:hypothetical protein
VLHRFVTPPFRPCGPKLKMIQFDTTKHLSNIYSVI